MATSYNQEIRCRIFRRQTRMIELPKSIHRSQDDLPSDAEELKDCQGDCKNGTFFLLYAESDEFLLEAVSAVQHSGQIWEAWNLGKVADGAETFFWYLFV